MEDLKIEIKQIRNQILAGIKECKIEPTWGILIVDNCDKALTLCGVGSSIIHEPYLKVEKDHQLIKMEELGINTTCQMFEQCINGVLYELKELKR